MTAKRSALARRYAQALPDLSAKSLEAIITELSGLLQQLIGRPELWAELNNQAVPSHDKVARLEECHLGLSQEAMALLRLLIEHGRVQLLPDVVAELHRKYLDATDQMELTAVSAVPMSDAQVADLERALRKRFGRLVTVRPMVDAKILGGLIITGDSWELDLSLRTRLARLQACLETGQASPESLVPSP